MKTDPTLPRRKEEVRVKQIRENFKPLVTKH